MAASTDSSAASILPNLGMPRCAVPVVVLMLSFNDSMSTTTGTAQRGIPKFGRIDAALESVEAAIKRSRDYIFSTQDSDGFWCGELEADAMLEADYIFVHRFLGTGDEAKMRRALTEMLRFQNDDGGWSIYPGGPGNISLTVKCYFAGKLMGMTAAEPILVKAREWILAHGGV